MCSSYLYKYMKCSTTFETLINTSRRNYISNGIYLQKMTIIITRTWEYYFQINKLLVDQ